MDETYSKSDMRLLKTENFADATVQCENKSWSVHKTILCSRSVWFDKALNGKFKEAATSSVVIQETSPDKVHWLLTYIYGGDASIAKFQELSSNIFLALCEAYELADYFALPLLAGKVLKTLMDDALGPGIAYFQLEPIVAKRSGKPMDPSVYYDAFFEGVKRAYSLGIATFRPLQRTFVEYVRRSRYLCLKDAAFYRHLKDAPGFSTDVLTTLCNEMESSQIISVPIYFPPHCKACSKATPRGKVHFADTSEGKDTKWTSGICSECYKQKE